MIYLWKMVIYLWKMEIFHGFLYVYQWLVVSMFQPTQLKNMSHLGWLFPIYGKIKVMFETTNQFRIVPADDVRSIFKHQ